MCKTTTYQIHKFMRSFEKRFSAEKLIMTVILCAVNIILSSRLIRGKKKTFSFSSFDYSIKLLIY